MLAMKHMVLVEPRVALPHRIQNHLSLHLSTPECPVRKKGLEKTRLCWGLCFHWGLNKGGSRLQERNALEGRRPPLVLFLEPEMTVLQNLATCS